MEFFSLTVDKSSQGFLSKLDCSYSKIKCFQLKNGRFLTGFSGGSILRLPLLLLTIITPQFCCDKRLTRAQSAEKMNLRQVHQVIPEKKTPWWAATRSYRSPEGLNCHPSPAKSAKARFPLRLRLRLPDNSFQSSCFRPGSDFGSCLENPSSVDSSVIRWFIRHPSSVDSFENFKRMMHKLRVSRAYLLLSILTRNNLLTAPRL